VDKWSKAVDTLREPALAGRLDGQRDRVETDQYIEEPVEFTGSSAGLAERICRQRCWRFMPEAYRAFELNQS
jgi:hypothetical protein